MKKSIIAMAMVIAGILLVCSGVAYADFNVGKIFGYDSELEFSETDLINAQITGKGSFDYYDQNMKVSEKQEYYIVQIGSKKVSMIRGDNGQYYVAEGTYPKIETEFHELVKTNKFDDEEITYTKDYGLNKKVIDSYPKPPAKTIAQAQTAAAPTTDTKTDTAMIAQAQTAAVAPTTDTKTDTAMIAPQVESVAGKQEESTKTFSIGTATGLQLKVPTTFYNAVLFKNGAWQGKFAVDGTTFTADDKTSWTYDANSKTWTQKNDKGQEIRRMTFDNNNQNLVKDRVTKPIYDGKGNVVSETTVTKDAGGKETSRIISESMLDKDGKTTSKTITAISSDGSKSAQELSYENNVMKSSIVVTYASNGEPTSYTTLDANLRIVKEVVYDAGKFMCGNAECSKDDPLAKQLSALRTQWKSKEFFSNLDFAFTAFRGLSGFSSLIWGDDKLNEWRENVDKLFASAYLGTEYWTSEICKSNIENIPSNVAMVETAPGVYQAAATISAERSPAVPFTNATIGINQSKVQYLYRISAYVKAVEDNTKFNIYIAGPKNLRKPVLNETKTLDEDGTFSLTGDAIIIKYSSYYYDTVCLVFESGGIETTCNKIAEAAYAVLTTTATTAATTSQSSWEEW